MKRILVLMLVLLLLAGCTHLPDPPATDAVPDRLLLPIQARQLLDTPEGLLVCGEEKWLLLSREDQTVLAEFAPEAGSLAYVQMLDDAISIADPEKGTVTLLSPELTATETIPCTAGGGNWIVRLDGGEVYALTPQGIEAWDLSDGSSRELLRCRYLSILYTGRDAIGLAAIGEDDILNHWYTLDLTDGTLTELEGRELIAIQEGLVPRSDGTFLRKIKTRLDWYDENGSCLGTLELADSGWTPGSDFVRAEKGWFFLTYQEDACQLMYWEPEAAQGEVIDLQPEQIPEGELLPQELYDRAAALSARFDVDIRIADRALRNYKAYDSGMLTDPELTAQALDVLEQTLSVYPEGFFSQLKYGNRRTVCIELVDWLKGKEGKDVSSGTSAFTLRLDRCCMIVLNARRIRSSAIFHEFSHIIDDRMAFESLLRADALYSEEGWLRLQPEGFRYADSYRNIPQEVKAYYDSGYFATNYACVSATEDRAVTMEKAMMLERAVFDANPGLMSKLRYYCDCIRDSFDTTGWPEKTPWEMLLD